VSALRNRVRPDLIDTMMDLYCDWRTACGDVQAAYDEVWDVAPSERARAFAAYTAALDREESACDAYAGQVRLIAARCAGDPNVFTRRWETGCK
jgi:hypothetical protein